MIPEPDPLSSSDLVILASGEFSACDNFDLTSKEFSVLSVVPS